MLYQPCLTASLILLLILPPVLPSFVPGGNNYSTHKGAGDWPHGGGGMHTAHTGGWWYIKTGYAHNPYCNANSHRQGNCDIMLWVR